jgi:hypothetical protein
MLIYEALQTLKGRKAIRTVDGYDRSLIPLDMNVEITMDNTLELLACENGKYDLDVNKFENSP